MQSKLILELHERVNYRLKFSKQLLGGYAEPCLQESGFFITKSSKH